MRTVAGFVLMMTLVCGIAQAAPNFSDDFEGGGGAWTKWPGASDSFVTDSSHNHTAGGQFAAKTPSADPWTWMAYHDFGATSEAVIASVWLFEDNGEHSREVSALLQLSGAESPPDFNVDYLQLGIMPWFPATNTGYGFRTKYNDDHGLGYGNANVSRVQGWTKLSIEADAVADGGQVRFLINDSLVGTSQRSGDLQYIRIGAQYKSYENFWYDDVSVTPEPASLLLLLIGGFALIGRRR